MKTTLNTHVLDANNVTDKELKDAQEDIKKAVKAGKDEQKTIWEALMEAVGLKDVFEAFKQMDTLTLIIVAVGATLEFLGPEPQLRQATQTTGRKTDPAPQDENHGDGHGHRETQRQARRVQPHQTAQGERLREARNAAHNLAQTAETLREKFVRVSKGFSTAADSLGT
ncbi:hypothetical protein ACIBVL_43180 [Streptomyces sp. NPDC049687]|uniref:hypothetical protein n=1 Tax=Streptomyces sp. NPDC049687 TaxID=3365596 RepID=UPI0037B207E6